MKNIHVLPTNKPSRLCLDSKDKLWFAKNSGYTIADGKVNIYITSDEEIKEDDYRMNIQRGYFKKSDKEGLDYYNKRNDVFKKIILTTDQDLIKDGVQAIDDEFLEWFVKNPSCKFVEVEKGKDPTDRAWYNTVLCRRIYKIIIPQEEPKQERKIDTCHNFDIEIGCVKDKCRCEDEEPKQEKEQDKKLYSGEEVIAIVEKSRETGLTAEYLLLTEQFKKK
jgi:hypothetical protein